MLPALQQCLAGIAHAALPLMQPHHSCNPITHAALPLVQLYLLCTQEGHDSGTMVAYGTGHMPGGTMVVNADASSSRSSTLGPAGTFVTAGGEAGSQGGSDYQAAVQAASQGADG